MSKLQTGTRVFMTSRNPERRDVTHFRFAQEVKQDAIAVHGDQMVVIEQFPDMGDDGAHIQEATE